MIYKALFRLVRNYLWPVTLRISLVSLICIQLLHPDTPPAMPALTPEMSDELTQMMIDEQLKLKELKKNNPAEYEKQIKTTAELIGIDPQELLKAQNELLEMNPEELGVTLNMALEELNSIAEQMGKEAQPDSIQPQQPSTPKKTAPKKKAVTTTSSKTTATALSMLTTLSSYLEKFLTITESTPKFIDYVDKWNKNDELKKWNGTLTWAKLKPDIEKLNKEIQFIIHKFTLYSDIFISDDFAGLYSTLKNLEEKLNLFIPTIIAPDLGQASMTKESQQASLDASNALIDAIYYRAAFEDIQKLRTRIEPLEKEIQEEEQDATKKAVSDLKRKKSVSRAKVVGTPEQDTPLYEPRNYDYYYPSNYAPYGGTGSYDHYGYNPSSYSSDYDSYDDYDKKPGSKSSSDDTNSDKKDSKSDDKKDNKKSKDSSTELIKDSRLDKILGKIEDKLETIQTEYFAQYKDALENLNRDLHSQTSAVNETLKQRLPGLTQDIEATTKLVKSFADRQKDIEDSTQKDGYKKKFNDTLDKKITDKLTNLANQIKDIKNVKNLPEEKRKAFFAPLTEDTEKDTTQEDVLTGILPQLQKSIEDLFKAAHPFDTQKKSKQ